MPVLAGKLAQGEAAVGAEGDERRFAADDGECDGVGDAAAVVGFEGGEAVLQILDVREHGLIGGLGQLDGCFTSHRAPSRAAHER